MWLGLQGIPEEDDKVDFSSCDLGSNLLVPAERAALQFIDFEAQAAFEQQSGRARGIEFMMKQRVSIEFRPFQQVTLLVVMSHEGDFLSVFHCLIHTGERGDPLYPSGSLPHC